MPGNKTIDRHALVVQRRYIRFTNPASYGIRLRGVVYNIGNSQASLIRFRFAAKYS